MEKNNNKNKFSQASYKKYTIIPVINVTATFSVDSYGSSSWRIFWHDIIIMW